MLAQKDGLSRMCAKRSLRMSRMTRMSRITRVVAPAFALCVASTAWSATLYVDGNPSDSYTPPSGSTVYTTIQAAIDAAANGDVVKVYPGDYTSTQAEVVNLRGKAIVVEAAIARIPGNGATYARIDGQDQRRCVVATLNETEATVVRGFELWRGRASAGAGMYVVNGDPRIEDCRFISNVATGGVASGGGLRLLNSASVIHECYFDNNSADAEGGGIFNANGPLMITSCEFVNNRAPRGGGYFTR
ncbi:MAG: right-handed parallel beta-helix repeat-containing protein, partial [Limnohabitans sp.]|nr:right-handed parallel beta-helix repeat-containing protein [Limnohabitans sp.]